MDQTIAAHWSRLGIAPTDDPAVIRSAYARALKGATPESDPQGFQALRESFEAVLSQHPTAPPGEDSAAAADIIQRDLRAHRAAGDTQGAIRLIDRVFENNPPGAPLIDTLDGLLFRSVSLERLLSPALFNHLVARFDWRDASCPAARSDPKNHAILLARVEAEDWYGDLQSQARDQRLPASALLHIGPQPIPVFDGVTKEEARGLMAALLGHGQFLLDRFDARSLAIVRQAVEGEPLIVAPAQPTGFATAATAVAKRRRSVFGWARIAYLGLVIIGAIAALAQYHGPSPSPDAPPAAQARSVLDQTTPNWVDLRPFNGKTLIEFTQLVVCRAALSAIRYGLDGAPPTQDFPLPTGAADFPQKISPGIQTSVWAPASLRSVTVQLVYKDGTQSPIETYRAGATQ